MTQHERQAIFDTARDTVLATLPEAWAVYVYGSFARGEEWPDSDVDIAVLLPPEQRIPDILELMGERLVGLCETRAATFELSVDSRRRSYEMSRNPFIDLASYPRRRLHCISAVDSPPPRFGRSVNDPTRRTNDS